MAKQKTTTKTTKKWRYSSFKAKIDDLHIEPAKNLAKRAHDFVETSHFLASFDYWKEINLSAGFTSYVHEVENIIQTLPQILYHDKKIFERLIAAINQYDTFALQPLLDLLAQFCHDLGPDFMKFYKDAVSCLIKLLDEAIKFEDPNIFEWGFNGLAYIFKYLSKILTSDLRPTFELLFPLLTSSKDYLSRFSAEAMSFLIRKSNIKKLNEFIEFSYNNDEISDSNSTYYSGLITLFSESLMTTQNSLHSRSKLIFSCLLDKSLRNEFPDRCVSLIADIWLIIAKHTSQENMEPIYQDTEEFLKEHINLFDPNRIARFLSVLSFAESGRKVNDWNELTSLIDLLCSTYTSKLEPMVVSFLFTVVLRNSEVNVLSKYHQKMFEFYLSNFPNDFIKFFRYAIEFSPERLFSFNGSKFFQKFLNSNIKECYKTEALFFLETSTSSIVESKLHVTIPTEEAAEIYKDFFTPNKELELSDIYVLLWNIILLEKSSSPFDTKIIQASQTILQSTLLTNDFVKDTLGFLLGLVNAVNELPESFIQSIFDNFNLLKTSKYFLSGFLKMFKNNKEDKILIKILNKSKDDFLLNITSLLSLPDSNTRVEALNLLIFSMESCELDVPQLLLDCRNLEQIPLSLQNARDITARLRNMGSEFLELSSNTLIKNAFIHHLFGLLTVRFSPVWDGVYEILPNVYSKAGDLTWQLIFKLLTISDENYMVQYYDLLMDEDDMAIPLFSTETTRFNDTVSMFSSIWGKYSLVDQSIINYLENNRGNLAYVSQLRSQALKVMLLLSQLTERHSRDVVPFMFNEREFQRIFKQDISENTLTHSAATWNETDRKSLLKVITKFKNIKAVYKSDEIYARLLLLLGSRTNEIQKLALDGILSYKNPILIKFRDNLQNLLDDTLFKDEITTFLGKDLSMTITDTDQEILLPIVLRILFGRAQTVNSSGIKKGRKSAVFSILPTLKSKYIIQFLQLGSARFNHEYYYANNHIIKSDEVDSNSLRRMTGFVTVLNLTLSVLGSNYPEVLEAVILPLLYTVTASNYANEKSTDDQFILKVSSNLRQQSSKCLNTVFQNIGNKIDWSNFMDDIQSIVVAPRLEKFETENLQGISSLMSMISFWATDNSFYPFLYYNDFACAKALMKTLCNVNAKENVINQILTTSNNIIVDPVVDDQYAGLVAIIASTCLQILPTLYDKLSSPETITVAVSLLLNMAEAGFIQDNETRKYLIDSLTLIIDGKIKNVAVPEVTKILKALSIMVSEFECEWNDIEPLYKSVAGMYRVYVQKDIRIALGSVFQGIASKFSNITKVASLLSSLNAYSTSRIEEYDFPTRLSAFKKFLDSDCMQFSELEWLPVLYNCLFFMKDKEELSIRTNASYTLMKYIDFIENFPTAIDAQNAIKILRENILPYIRTGLKSKFEELLNEYISVLAYIVKQGKHFNELSDMQILFYNDDEEANFFTNINHIQLHRRQRAIKRLRDFTTQLSDNSIAHYILPIIETFIFKTDEKYRNIMNEAFFTIGALSNSVSWNQYKAILRRYVGQLKSNGTMQKEYVLLVNQVSGSLKDTLRYHRGLDKSHSVLTKFPNSLNDPDRFIKLEIYPILVKILGERNDETIIARIPLAEALVNFILGLAHEDTVSMLPGVLTSICQILRSKSDDLREATRKTLARCAVVLGPEYLSFIIQELVTALRRGSQVHVLSFTVHHILKALDDIIQQADLDSSVELIVRVIMEDIFGSASEEKESDNYHTKMLEVKVNRSYDTAEILASNISLPEFDKILKPVKALLRERMRLKSQNKLAELLRRYALGLNHNTESSSPTVLAMCYEIYQDTEITVKKKVTNTEIDEKEKHFLVDLNFKNTRVQNEVSIYGFTLQKFALDLLRTVLSRNRTLLTVENMSGFIPLLRDSLLSENEGLLISTLRLLGLLLKLDFPEETEVIFKNCARKVLTLIKNSPSTSSELCQMGLKFLSSFIRHKDFKLKPAALSYILGRLLPDLNEPSRQGLAFNFLKALVFKHIELPEIYDVLDTVREIMVTNHSREIRDVSRSVYYQFLMEYDQSKGRLEKQFQFMVDNLQYPTQDGRQSVMELINLIITKANPLLLAKLSSSFFVALSSISFNDDAPKCREMATILLSSLLERIDASSRLTIEKYMLAWLKNNQNLSFLNLGLRIYKIYLTSLGCAQNKELDDLVLVKIKHVVNETQAGSEIEWDLIYTSLNVFQELIEADKTNDIYKTSYKELWDGSIKCLLFPHSWVRQVASRIINKLVGSLEKFEVQYSDSEIQTIASRILRQIGAPSIPENLSSISIKTLVKISMRWKDNNTPYIQNDDQSNELKKYSSAIGFVIVRLGSIIRNEENPQDFFMSKKTSIQLLALLIQMLDESTVQKESENIILPLYPLVEFQHSYNRESRNNTTEEKEELQILANECIQVLEKKLNVSDFTMAYSNVKQVVIQRRKARKAQRAILAVNAPDLAAQRKLKKHARSREKRKHEKDDNGYYQRKNKKKRA